MKNKEIKNKNAYFRKIVKNMDRQDLGKRVEIEYFEIFSDEMEIICYSEDKYFGDNWLEIIENAELYEALKHLNLEEKILISEIYFEEKTQSEVAKIYKVKRQTISGKLTEIINKIKDFLCKK